jgi:hypothetical protein
LGEHHRAAPESGISSRQRIRRRDLLAYAAGVLATVLLERA